MPTVFVCSRLPSRVRFRCRRESALLPTLSYKDQFMPSSPPKQGLGTGGVALGAAVRVCWCEASSLFERSAGRPFALLLGALTFSLVAGCAAARPADSTIDPRADEQLRALGRTIGAARQFSFRERIAQEVVVGPRGPVTCATERRVRVRRPNRLAVDLNSAAAVRRTRFDGRTLITLDVDRRAYARVDGVRDLDELVGRLRRELAYRNPLAGLLVADPYAALRAELLAARYVGTETVAGRACHHLACRSRTAEWEAWLEADAAAVPRRLVVRYTDLPGQPVHDATLDEWNLDAQFAAAEFELVLPPDTYEMEVMEVSGLP